LGHWGGTLLNFREKLIKVKYSKEQWKYPVLNTAFISDNALLKTFKVVCYLPILWSIDELRPFDGR
jgi:hypothetical protein